MTEEEIILEESRKSDKKRRKNKSTLVPVFVKPELCSQCELCVEVCPENAIRLEKGFICTDRLCKSCGACVTICPDDAIEMMEKA